LQADSVGMKGVRDGYTVVSYSSLLVQPTVRRWSGHRVRSRDDIEYTRMTTKMAAAHSVGSTSGQDVTQAQQWTSLTCAVRGLVCIYTVSQKKQDTWFFIITLANVNRFSKFLHSHIR